MSRTEIEIEKEIYLDLLGELGATEYKHAGDSYEEAYKKIIEYVNDRIAALDVAEELVNDKKQYTMADNYADIVTTARKLGINYVGVSKERLLREVNKHVI